MQSRKASSDPAPPPSALAGQVSRISIGDMLASLEVRGRSAVVRFEGNGPADSATVWLADGRLVDAEAGELSGEAAVYRILGLTHGRFEVSHEPVDRPKVIGDSVAALVRKRAKRAARWQDLLLGGSGLNAIPELSGVSLEKLEGDDAKLLKLLDGRKSLLEILDESRLDPVVALEMLRRLEGEGYFSVRRPSSGPPRPDPHRDRISPVPSRTSTLIGVPAATPVPPGDSPLSTTLIGGPESGWSDVRSAALSSGTPPDESGVTATQLRGGDRASWPSLEFSQQPPSASDDFERRSFPSGPPQSLSPGPASPGATLGGYEVLFRLAHGTTSSVYLCREAGLGSVRSLFTLKSFELPSGAIDDFCERVQRMAGLSHPNLVPVLRSFPAPDRALIVSEYVEGTSLAALMKRQPSSRPTALVVAVLFDALRGLRAAHEASAGGPFVHGALSPRDLLLGVEGICRVADVAAGAALRATTGLEPPDDAYRMGYVAPERLLGRAVDERSDVFSIGVCLYEALTGTELFRTATPEQTRRNVLEQLVLPPSQVGLRPPSAFDDVCLRALNRDPQQRFAAIRDFLVELELAALDHDTLASAADVAAWIGNVFGRDFELRRLSILDASRRSRISRPPSVPAGAIGAQVEREQGSLRPPSVDAETSQLHARHPKPRAMAEVDEARASSRDSSPVLAIAELPDGAADFDAEDPLPPVPTGSRAGSWLLGVAAVLVVGAAWWFMTQPKQAVVPAAPVDRAPAAVAPPPTPDTAPVPPPPAPIVAPTEAAAPEPDLPPPSEVTSAPASLEGPAEDDLASKAARARARRVAPRAPQPPRIAPPSEKAPAAPSPPADEAPPPAPPAAEEPPPPPPPAKSDSDFSYGI